MLDIFSRLPIETVLDCKSVSKTWKNVLRNPYFSRMHSQLLLSNPDSAADSGKFRFIFKVSDEFYYLEYDDENSSHRVKKLNLNPPFKLYSFLGSCNGLICINGLPNHYTVDNSGASYVAFICNPITRECITLPELDRATYYRRVRLMFSGFGYVASTNEYKVVRFYTFQKEDENKFAQIEVYTLGSGKGWRNAGKINVDPNSVPKQHAVFANGFLFWDFGKGKTLAFDLAGEVFVVVECSNFHYGDFRIGALGGIGVWGGYLCGTHSRDGRSSDIWFLMKNKEDESFSWTKMFVSINKEYSSLAITSSCRVLCYENTKLHLYDLKSFTSKILKYFGPGRIIYEAIHHMNTLVSLKAIGKENTETLASVGSKRNSKNHHKRKNRYWKLRRKQW